MNYLRQLSLIDPKDIKNKTVTVIGAGATGSYVALQLAQLGWGNTPQEQGKLRVWDADTVEEHNLANQAYDKTHIGMAKVDALNDIILKKCGFEIEVHNAMVTDQKEIQSTYVFILTDTMSSRREIIDNCLQFAFDTDLVIETRMGIDGGRIYAFNPNDTEELEAWKKTLYSDDVADASACGASASIVPTVYCTASLAVWRLIHHFDVMHGKNYAGNNLKSERTLNETQFTLGPDSFFTRRFNDVSEACEVG